MPSATPARSTPPAAGPSWARPTARAASSPPEELIVFDGKEPHHTGGQQMLTAVTVTGQRYLGSVMVADHSNEIPAAHDLCARRVLDGRVVSLNALHTQADTARASVLAHGADQFLTVKGNQPTVRANLERPVATPPVAFPLKVPRPWPAPTSATKAAPKPAPLQSAPITAEAAAFPLAAQAAKWTATTPAASSSPSPSANPTSTPFREYALAADQLTSCRLSFAIAMLEKHHRIYGSHPHRFRHLEWRPVHALRPTA